MCDPFTNKTSELAPIVLLNKSIPVEILLSYLDSAIKIGSDVEEADEHQSTVANYNMALYGGSSGTLPSVHKN